MCFVWKNQVKGISLHDKTIKTLDLTHKIPEAYEKTLLPYHRDGYVYRLCFC